MRVVRSQIWRALFVACCCCATAACSTPYQSSGFRGGYTDYRAGADTIYVSYEGNGFTSHETVTRYWHMRAAEICGGEGRYEVVSRDDETATEQVGGTTTQYSGTATTYGNQTRFRGTAVQSEPIEFTKYGAHGYVRCVNGGSYDSGRSLWSGSGPQRAVARESTPGDEALTEARSRMSTAHSVPEHPSSPIAKHPVVAPQPATVSTAGCQYDTQCKGDRICQNGACVDPTAPKSADAPPTSDVAAQ